MPKPDYYKINAPKVVFEVYDGEIIFMNLENGNYYNVINSAAEICNLIIKGRSCAEIIRDLQLKYVRSGEHIGSAVRHFLANLEKEGIFIPAAPEINSNTRDQTETAHVPDVPEKPLFEIPVLNCYSDMQQLILLDPVHEVGDEGWPNPKPDQKQQD